MYKSRVANKQSKQERMASKFKLFYFKARPRHIFKVVTVTNVAKREVQLFLPWYPSSLHLVGHSDVSGPDVILPAFLTQHSAQDRTTVHSNPHVHIGLGLLTNVPAVGFKKGSTLIQPSRKHNWLLLLLQSLTQISSLTPQIHSQPMGLWCISFRASKLT